MESDQWNKGEPSDKRIVLVIAQEAGMNDAALLNTFGYAIARWDDHAKEWRPVGFPSFTGRQSASTLTVRGWRELPTPPSGIKLYED
jgi:hypothetical protein